MSAKIYDISSYITNELPKMMISDDIVVTINNRKSVILNVQAMIMEFEKKASKQNVDPAEADIKMMEKTLQMLIGESNAKKIEELDLPLPEYKKIFETIMAAAQGIDPDELNKNTP